MMRRIISVPVPVTFGFQRRLKHAARFVPDKKNVTVRPIATVTTGSSARLNGVAEKGSENHYREVGRFSATLFVVRFDYSHKPRKGPGTYADLLQAGSSDFCRGAENTSNADLERAGCLKRNRRGGDGGRPTSWRLMTLAGGRLRVRLTPSRPVVNRVSNR